MAGDPRLFTPRRRLYSPGYTPTSRLRRVTEDRQARVLETAGHYRVAERNTVLTA